MMKRWLGLLAAWLIVELLPRAASACAVCTAGRDDETNQAFLISTIFMSLLPLAALGTLLFVLWRRVRALEADGAQRESARTAAPEADAPATTPAVLTPPAPAR